MSHEPFDSSNALKEVHHKPVASKKRADTAKKPRFPIDHGVGQEFSIWLSAACGGGMSRAQAKQIATRVMKFLKYCNEDDEDDLSTDFVDYCLASPSLITKFVEYIREEWKLSSSAQINYFKAISDMIDYHRSQGISANTQRNFTIAEIYICRGKRTLTRRKWIEWSEELTVENLEAVNAWATLEELQQVIPYHFPRYIEVLQKCKKELNSDVPSHDLTFATRFLSVYLFVQVKGSRPMTYQYLTVTMFHNSKIHGGFVDQTEFKTAQQYTFDSLLFDEKRTELIDDYISFVRPRLHPKCDYVLVTRNGTQCSKLSDLMSRLVYEAIGKHIHPTHYRQIVKTESAARLSLGEQDIISHGQKHSSHVARTYYQKISSRNVAAKARQCMDKLRGQSQTGEGLTTHGKRTAVVDCKQARAKLDCRVSDINDDELFLTQTDWPKRKVTMQQNQIRSKSRRVCFSTEEDRFITEGINKHGFGRWTAVLRDPDYNFLGTCTCDSIMKRARTLTNRKTQNATKSSMSTTK